MKTVVFETRHKTDLEQLNKLKKKVSLIVNPQTKTCL